MPTTKLNLPLIDGTNTADVVRDFNALANAVDNKVGSPDGVASLGADGKVPASQLPTLASTATDISITDTANYYTATNVEGALAELGQTLNGTRASIASTAQALGVM